MAKTTETIGEFTMNILTAEQYADAKKNNQIDPNQLYFTPEKKLVVAVSQDEYEAMKEAGTLDEDVFYVTPASESVTIPEATEATAGLMPPSAVTKLKGIADGANKYIHPAHTARASGLYKITVDSLGHVTAVSAVQKQRHHRPGHSWFRHDLRPGLGLQQRPDEPGPVFQAVRH